VAAADRSAPSTAIPAAEVLAAPRPALPPRYTPQPRRVAENPPARPGRSLPDGETKSKGAPPPAIPTRAPLRPGDVYVVVRGDSLWSISGRFLHDPHAWPELFDVNRRRVLDPDLIRPGQRITVPEPSPRAPAR
jgi:nucleoid-associated protein YgaU